MNSIHSFRGIPAGAFAYDNISRLQGALAATKIGHAVGVAAANAHGGNVGTVASKALGRAEKGGGGGGGAFFIGGVSVPTDWIAGGAVGLDNFMDCVAGAGWGQNACSGSTEIEEQPPLLHPEAAQVMTKNALRGCAIAMSNPVTGRPSPGIPNPQSPINAVHRCQVGTVAGLLAGYAN
jgi:hypothetical protein